MKRRKSLLIILLTMLLLVACATPPWQLAPPVAPTATVATIEERTTATTTSGFPLTLNDRLGRELTFDQPPQRVVCYYNDCYGILASLNFKPVAQSVNPEMLTDPIYFDGTGASIKTLRWEGDTVDLEDVAAAQPDLVFVWSEEEVTALEGIAPAFASLDPANLEELYAVTASYGRLLGQTENATAAIAHFQERYQAYQQLAPKDVSVLKLGVMDDQKFYVSTVDDPICQILNMVATCQWEKATPDEFWGYETTLEGILQLDPDVIILNNWSSADRVTMEAALADNPLWNELRAVQNERVLSTPGYENPIASSLPAASKFLDTYLPLLYPEVFPTALTDEQVAEILGKEAAGAVTDAPLTITDGEGQTLTFDQPPQRLVCTYSRCMELLAALEIEPVGVTTWEESFIKDPLYFPQPTTTQILDYDGDFPNLEQLAALKPDLVFGWQELGNALAGIAPVYNVANDQNSYAKSHEEIRAFARLLGREEIAERNIQAALDRLAAYKRQAPNHLSVMYGFFSDGSFHYRDDDSGTCNLFKEIADCAWPDPTNSSSWSVEVGDEGLLALDPDVLLIDGYGFDGKSNEQILVEVSARPLWGELKAVKNGRVYVASDAVANLDGMGTVGMQKMLDVYAPLLYPDLFPAPLTDEQVQAILAEAQ